MFEFIEACQQCEPIGLPGQFYCRDCGLRTAPTSPSLSPSPSPTRIRTARADVTQHVRSRVHRMTARAATARRRHGPASPPGPAGPGLLRQAVARVAGCMMLPARRRRR